MTAEKTRITVKYAGIEYDVTNFLKNHPGGEEVLESFNGMDIDDVLRDKNIHKHSKNAIETLLSLQKVGSAYSGGKHDESKAKPFLDLNKPLLAQLWNSNFDKQTYLEQVHIPRYLNGNARLFENDFLEFFTKTKWSAIPMFWIPVILVLLKYGSGYYSNGAFGFFVLLGLLKWTFFEYLFHRFVFHAEKIIPNTPKAFTFHFLIHGVHHYLPMDPLRLVMPPLLLISLSSMVIPVLYHVYINYLNVHEKGVALMVAGAYVGYLLYDMSHYYMHHGSPAVYFLKKMKTYHTMHHYIDSNKGFGVSSKMWDVVFNTELPLGISNDKNK